MSTTPTTPQAAQQLLDQAQKLQQSVAGFSLSWIGYFGICAGGALHTIAASAWRAAGFSTALLLATTLIWISCCVIFTVIVAFRAGSAPRGFATRWVTMMGLWSILWVASMTLSSEFTAVSAMALSLGFLALALAGPTWELLSLRRRN